MKSEVHVPSIAVEIVDAHAETTLREKLTLPAGATVAAALQMSSLARAHELNLSMQAVDHIADSFVGIWGRRTLLSTTLTEGDRVELYRELIADAKSARLKRASEQGYRWQGRTRRVVTSGKA